MKTFVALLALTASTASFAGQKFICKEITKNSWDSKKTMVLTQIGNESIREGRRTNFVLEIFDGQSSRPLLTERVSALLDDVLFSFANGPKKINGGIYLDELDQAYLTIGRNKFSFDCN